MASTVCARYTESEGAWPGAAVSARDELRAGIPRLDSTMAAGGAPRAGGEACGIPQGDAQSPTAKPARWQGRGNHAGTGDRPSEG